MNFSFRALAECQRCGGPLQNSEQECEACVDRELRRFRFEHIRTGELKTVWSADGRWAWTLLMKQVDEPLPWRSVSTGATTLHKRRMGQNMLEIWESYQ